MTPEITTIVEELAILKDRSDLFYAALHALQDICVHDYGSTGHGHNYTIEVCSNCGKEIHT